MRSDGSSKRSSGRTGPRSTSARATCASTSSTGAPTSSPATTPDPTVHRLAAATGRPAPDDAGDDPAGAATDRPATASATPPPTGAHVVVSPSPGILWRSPEPGAPPFADVGDVVDASATVCIVEVMKLMNHVKAGVSGEVVAVYVENGVAVQKGRAPVRDRSVRVVVVTSAIRHPSGAGRQPRRDRGADRPGLPGRGHRSDRGRQRGRPGFARRAAGDRRRPHRPGESDPELPARRADRRRRARSRTATPSIPATASCPSAPSWPRRASPTG